MTEAASRGGSEKGRTTPMGSGAEFDLIRMLVGEPEGYNPVHSPAVSMGPGDDAAVLLSRSLAGQLVVSTDLSVEDVHFRRSWVSFEEVGFRAVMAAASDLAAMAARPVAVLLSVAVADTEAETVLAEVGRGVRDALAGLDVPLVGGDLSASPGPLLLDVTVLGETGDPILRNSAVDGDELWVTGRLGGSAAAVRAWRSGDRPLPGLREAFARPVARVREALWLAEHGNLHAMIDLSDGLEGDAGHLAAASGVRIEIEPDLVPLHPDLGADDLSLGLSGGEDYELCIAAPPGAMVALVEAFDERFQAPLTRVGRVIEGAGAYVLPSESRGGGSVAAGGFDHFAGEEPAC